MRILVGVCVLCLLVPCLALALEPAHTETIYKPEEIVWFGASGNLLVVEWGDLTVSVTDLESGKPVSKFAIDAVGKTVRKPELCVSGTGTPRLAVTYRNGRDGFEGIVDFYDLNEGKRTERAVIEKARGCTGLGFSGDGKRFFCAATHANESLVTLDAEEGFVVRRVLSPEISLGCVTSFQDGNAWARFYLSGMDIVDAEGKVLVKYERKSGTHMEPAWCGSLPHWPFFVYDVEHFGDDCEYIAMNRDGKRLWTLKTKELSLLALSSDGLRQAVVERDSVVILSLPGKERVALKEQVKDEDALFANNDKWLICMPMLLDVVAEDKEAHTVTCARPSHSLRIFDAKTGARIREVPLKKP